MVIVTAAPTPAAPAPLAPAPAAVDATLGTPLPPPVEASAPVVAATDIPHLPPNLVLALEFVSLQRRADGAGGLVHAYTFRDG